MSYKVDTTLNFDKEVKKLAKKYKSLKEEIANLVEKLKKNPRTGTHLGNDIYKISLAVKSKGNAVSKPGNPGTCF